MVENFIKHSCQPRREFLAPKKLNTQLFLEFVQETYLMGNWAMSSDNSYKGPLECEEDKENEVDEDASSTMSDDDVDPLEILESSREDVDDSILLSSLLS